MACARIVENVSSTPSPRDATAANSGARRPFRTFESASTGTTSGKSRLLYWNTSGMRFGSSRCSTRLATISFRLFKFSCQRSEAELATNTTPSAPLTTMRRVVE